MHRINNFSKQNASSFVLNCMRDPLKPGSEVLNTGLPHENLLREDIERVFF